jgi:hypothetical protein
MRGNAKHFPLGASRKLIEAGLHTPSPYSPTHRLNLLTSSSTPRREPGWMYAAMAPSAANLLPEGKARSQQQRRRIQVYVWVGSFSLPKASSSLQCQEAVLGASQHHIITCYGLGDYNCILVPNEQLQHGSR